MLSPPPQKVQQWHDPIQCVKNNKIKISILNSISISKTQRARLAGQFKVSFNQPVKGVEGPLQDITRSWRNPLGTSSSHWTASAAGPTGTESVKVTTAWRLPACCVLQKVRSPRPHVPQLQGRPLHRATREAHHISHVRLGTRGDKNQHYQADPLLVRFE